MAVALGVAANLTEAKFNEQMKRHGQYVRWQVALTCPCVSGLGRVDPQCPICQGRGRVFRYQETAEYYNENSPHNESCVKVINPPIDSIKWVRRNGIEYHVDSHTDTTAEISVVPGSGLCLPEYWRMIDVTYQQRLTTDLVVDVYTYFGENIFRLDNLIFSFKRDDKVIRELPVDIVKVVYARDVTAAVDMPVEFIGRDIVRIKSTFVIDESHIFQFKVRVIKPFKFIVNMVSEKQKWQDAYVTEAGDAQLITPYNMLVGGGDLITLIAAERRGESQLEYYAGQDVYELAAYDVTRVLAILDSTGDDRFVYGTDYILYDHDKLKWLASGKKPIGRFAVSFMFSPMFSVLDDIPMLRTNENKRFPRKVGLKVFAKVNAEYEPNNNSHNPVM